MQGEHAEHTQDSRYLELPQCLDLRSAVQLKAVLSEALAIGAPLTVDASSVERLSTACVQILIAFAKAAREAGQGLIFQRPSNAFVGVFASLGLRHEMNNWAIEADPCAS